MKHKSQHVVPRSYLAGFVDPLTPPGQEPYVWVFDRGGSGPFAKAPHRVAARSHYYAFPAADGARDNSVEELLSEVESLALPPLRALTSGCEPSELSPSERRALAHFIAYLEVRVPRFRDYAERVSAAAMKRLAQVAAADEAYFLDLLNRAYLKTGRESPFPAEELRQLLLGGEYLVKAKPIYSLRLMVDVAPKIASIIERLPWRVLSAPHNERYITSDAPVVRVATAPIADVMGLGWGMENVEATFPLSPRECLLVGAGYAEGRESASEEQVREINWRVAGYAGAEVYSSAAFETAQLNPPANWGGWRPLGSLQARADLRARARGASRTSTPADSQ